MANRHRYLPAFLVPVHPRRSHPMPMVTVEGHATTLGPSSSAGVVLPDPYIQREATVTRRGNIDYVSPSACRWGVAVNDVLVKKPVALRNGQELRVGRTRLYYLAGIHVGPRLEHLGNWRAIDDVVTKLPVAPDTVRANLHVSNVQALLAGASAVVGDCVLRALARRLVSLAGTEATVRATASPGAFVVEPATEAPRLAVEAVLKPITPSGLPQAYRTPVMVELVAGAP